MSPLIAITGGIGSGKSAVCRCLAIWGMEVYDCDSRAKALMDGDPEIIRRLREDISPDTVKEMTIDRTRLAGIVFSNPDKLARLNAIVHGRVKEDIRRWRMEHDNGRPLFVETAILLESNLHLEVDEVWLVDAPECTRLRRACQRDQASEEAITARMRRQHIVDAADLTVPLRVINNDGHHPLIPRLRELLACHDVTTNTSAGCQWKN